MFRRPAQDIDEGLLGVLLPVERAEQNRAFDFGFDGIGRARGPRQKLVELPQPRFLRQPGSPAMIVAGNITPGSHVLFQSGHDVRVDAASVRSRHSPLIRGAGNRDHPC